MMGLNDLFISEMCCNGRLVGQDWINHDIHDRHDLPKSLLT